MRLQGLRCAAPARAPPRLRLIPRCMTASFTSTPPLAHAPASKWLAAHCIVRRARPATPARSLTTQFQHAARATILFGRPTRKARPRFGSPRFGPHSQLRLAWRCLRFEPVVVSVVPPVISQFRICFSGWLSIIYPRTSINKNGYLDAVPNTSFVCCEQRMNVVRLLRSFCAQAR